MVVHVYATAKEVSPMKYAVQHSDYLGNRMNFRFKKWFNFGTVSKAETCEYMVSRFLSLEKSNTKRAARKAVECAEFALNLKQHLILGESTYVPVKLISPLKPEFYARIAKQCAKGASQKNEGGNVFFAKATEYNEKAAGEYGKKDDKRKVVEQLTEAVDNYGKYVGGLEKLSKKEDSSFSIYQDMDSAKNNLVTLKKKLALAEALQLEAMDVGVDIVRRGDNCMKTAQKYLEAERIEKAVEKFVEAGEDYARELDMANENKQQPVRAKAAYRLAVAAYKQALTWASTTTGPGALDPAASTIWIKKIDNVLTSLAPKKVGN